jgi:hypothetical protein
MIGDVELGTVSRAWDVEAPAPWLLVVARGHARLVSELRALFRDDARVQVIENRREGEALLPRPATVSRVAIPGA